MSSLPHGGRLRAAAHDYRIPLQHWLDLSTGINPAGWPVPTLPEDVWRRLPEEDDGLGMASLAYFGGRRVLPVAGSQAAIQALPQLMERSRIGILSPCYREHERAWKTAGHYVESIDYTAAEQAISKVDVLLLTNPNNPTGRIIPPATLRQWHAALASRDGLLIVDEAFMDATPEASILADTGAPGLIVLRSLGKFFGLAGLRCGFVAGETALLERLAVQLGPWAVSHPARWVAQRALADLTWQAQTRQSLHAASARLGSLLDAAGLPSPSGCALFRWVPTGLANELFDAFARHAVLVRSFDDGLRFGLPGTEAQWQRLAEALDKVMA